MISHHDDQPVDEPKRLLVDHVAHAPHSVPAIKAFPDRLWVVCCVNNPARYHSRYRMYRAFEKHMHESGVELITIEAAFGDREFEVTKRHNLRHIQLRTSHEVWHKENLLNLAINRLPAAAKYIAFWDADFTVFRPDWAQETLQQLQHFQVVQLFSHVAYMGPRGEVMRTRLGFVESWMRGHEIRTTRGSARMELFWYNGRGVERPTDVRGFGCDPDKCPPAGGYPGPYPYPFAGGPGVDMGAPGGGWAFRREALDALGGLIDYCILGSADWFMAAGLFNFLHLVIPTGYNRNFARQLLAWQSLAERHIRRNVGCVPGTALHHWHGDFRRRHYNERESIIVGHQFDPVRDLKRDAQGLWQLEDDGTPRFIRLRDDLRAYFNSRNEDSIDAGASAP